MTREHLPQDHNDKRGSKVPVVGSTKKDAKSAAAAKEAKDAKKGTLCQLVHQR